MKERCPGERLDKAQGIGVASYRHGFRFSFFSGRAWAKANAQAKAALKNDLDRAKEAVCKNLCSDGCECIVTTTRATFDEFDVSFSARTTFFGVSWGGTWTITYMYWVKGECWR